MLASGELRPAVSVIVPAVNGPEILEECLAALRANHDVDGGLEVLIVERWGEETRGMLAVRAPEVRVLPVPATATIPEMRAIGFQQARGGVIAVIEDHTIVPPRWAEQLLAAVAEGADAVGGSLFNAATTTTVDRAAFLCEYSHLLSPERGRNVRRLTGTNVAYRRTLIDRYAAVLAAGRWEDYFHDALRRDGIALTCVPEIAVGHKMHYRMPQYLSQRYLFSRALTGTKSQELTGFQRALGVIKSLALPPVLLARIVRNVRASDRHRHELSATLPLLAVFVCAWALGEAVGYAAGPGDSLARVR